MELDPKEQNRPLVKKGKTAYISFNSIGSSFNTIIIWKYVLHINTLKLLKKWRSLEEISFWKGG